MIGREGGWSEDVCVCVCVCVGLRRVEVVGARPGNVPRARQLS